MPIAYCRSILLLCMVISLADCRGEKPDERLRSKPTQQAVEAARSGSAISIATGEGRADVPVDLLGVAIDPRRGHGLELLRNTPAYVVLIDNWSSGPQSMSRCQAGHERFLRIVSRTRIRETFAFLVESCLRDVVPADPLVEWTPDGLEIHILSGAPSAAISISPDGDVVVR